MKKPPVEPRTFLLNRTDGAVVSVRVVSGGSVHLSDTAPLDRNAVIELLEARKLKLDEYVELELREMLAAGTVTKHRPRAKRVTQPPGSALVRVVPYLFMFSRETIAHVFTQGLGDMREEYFAALAAKKPRLARAIYFRWCLSLFSSVVLQGGVSLAKKVHALWKLGGG